MPRTELDLGLRVESLSILDEEAVLDAALDPGIPPADLKRILQAMLLARLYDERKLRLQRQGRIGTFAPATGQEAAQVGSAYALDRDDWVVPSFRETPAALWRGARLEDDLLYCAGFDEGIGIPAGAHDLPPCIPVGSQVPHAAGLAWGLKAQGSDRVVLCYLGDGATSEGDFHEGLNFAALHQVPLVLLCQNNQWAISVPRREQTHSRTLAQKALAYDVPALVADGNDVLAVVAATREAVRRARQGRGPTFIEAVTYRMGVHTTADDPSLYRPQAEVEAWARRDPIERLRRHMDAQGWLGPGEAEAWREEAARRIDAAVRDFEKRRAARPNPARMFDHLYSRPSKDLQRQREELVARLNRARAADREGTEGQGGRAEGEGAGEVEGERETEGEGKRMEGEGAQETEGEGDGTEGKGRERPSRSPGGRTHRGPEAAVAATGAEGSETGAEEGEGTDEGGQGAQEGREAGVGERGQAGAASTQAPPPQAPGKERGRRASGGRP